MHQPASAASPSIAETIRETTGINATKCYQCGKCSAGCPMAAETTLRPHDIMRLVGQDRGERLLDDPAIWLCLSCEACTSRCPNGCDPARVIDALRELGAARAPRPISAFHRSFLDQIRSHGRMFELGLVLQYKMRSGALLQDAASTPAMLARGKLKLAPRRIRGIREVRRLFAATSREDA
jgi:heterodisulfide reductase subunit C